MTTPTIEQCKKEFDKILPFVHIGYDGSESDAKERDKIRKLFVSSLLLAREEALRSVKDKAEGMKDHDLGSDEYLRGHADGNNGALHDISSFCSEELKKPCQKE